MRMNVEAGTEWRPAPATSWFARYAVGEGVQAAQHEQLPRVGELRHAALGAIGRRHDARRRRCRHSAASTAQKHEHGLGLKADKPLAEERDDRAQQHRAGQEQEDAQQALKAGQHSPGGQQQEEPVAHARRQRARDREPQGRPRDPGGRHAQQRRGRPCSRRRPPSPRDSRSGARAAGTAAPARTPTAMKATSKVRCGSKSLWRRAQHARARRAGERQRRPGPGAPVGADVAPAAPQERPTIFRITPLFTLSPFATLVSISPVSYRGRNLELLDISSVYA